MLGILACAEIIPGETCENGTDSCLSTCQPLIMSMHWRPLLVPKAQLHFLKTTYFLGKSGVSAELQLHLHRRQFR